MYGRILLLLFYLHGCWSTATTTTTTTTGTTITRPTSPNKLVSATTKCTKDLFHIKLDMGKSFKGIVFAKDFSEECRTRGNLTTSVSISLPTSGCGVRSEPRPDEVMEFSVRLVVQMDGKLRQMADVEKVVRCTVPSEMMTMNVMQLDDKKNSSYRNGRMRTDIPSIAPTTRVRVWLELGGAGGAGAVEVGQPTTLGVRALLPRSIGVRVVDCDCVDGLGESSQKLLDERGCPVDEQVMPALLIKLRPTEEGWSKPHHDDLVEKLFTATFPAFKFPDRDRLHVSCGVQLCRGECPKVDCRSDEPFVLSTEKQLARIEIFNSLAVTAPQIELDRLQSEKRTNYSDDSVVSARVTKSDGTLCMSSSKLALAFCVLGLIFLIAVIVSVCCLLRARMSSNHSVRANGTSIFSSSSGSQSRMGSKLFVPYGGSLPYGRVY